VRFFVATWLVVSLLLAAASSQIQSKPLSNDDVIKMVSLGLSDEVIIERIRVATTTTFDISIEGLKTLKAAKVSDAVLKAVINPHGSPTGINETSAARPALTNPQAEKPATSGAEEEKLALQEFNAMWQKHKAEISQTTGGGEPTNDEEPKEGTPGPDLETYDAQQRIGTPDEKPGDKAKVAAWKARKAELMDQLSGEAIQAASYVSQVRNQMRDPDSFVLERVTTRSNKDGYSNVCVYFRSKNGFGGYEGGVYAFLSSNKGVRMVDVSIDYAPFTHEPLNQRLSEQRYCWSNRHFKQLDITREVEDQLDK
jgi:hypothetical protein